MAKKKKSKRRKSKSNKGKSRQPAKRQLHKKDVRSKLKKGFLLWVKLFVGLIGLIAAIYTFYPQVSVEVGRTLNPQAPFDTPFEIVNKSFFSITNVKVILGVDSIKIYGKGLLCLLSR